MKSFNQPNTSNITEVMMSFQGLSHTQVCGTHEYEVLSSDMQMIVDMMYDEGYNL